MPKPWERYQQQQTTAPVAAEGPWTKYQKPVATAVGPTNNDLYPPGFAGVGTGVAKGLTETARNLANNVTDPALVGDGSTTAPSNPLFHAIASFLRQIPRPGPESPESQSAWQNVKQQNPYTAEGGRILGRMAPSLAVMPQSFPGQILAGLTTALGDENPTGSMLANTVGTTLLHGAAKYGGQALNALTGKTVEPALDATGQTGAAINRAAAHPLTSGITNKMEEGRSAFLSGAAAKSMGTQITDMSDNGLPLIKSELVAKYDDIFKEVSKANGNLGIKLPEKYYDAAEELLPKLKFADFKDELAYGDVSGPTFKKLRSAVSELTDSSAKGDAARALIEKLDEEFAKQVPSDLKAAYDTTREQWRNFFAVESIKSESGRSGVGGILSPAQLQTKLRASYGSNPPRNPETQQLMDAAAMLAGRKPYPKAKDIGLLGNMVQYLGGAPAALQGAYKLGQPATGALTGNIGRLLSAETLRRKTPYFLDPNSENQ